MAFHPTGRFLATVARDDSVRLWDADSGQLVHRWKVPTNEWRDTRVAFSPGGELLASGSFDGRIRLWDVNSKAEYAVLEKHADAIKDVAFSPDGRWLASAGDIRDLTVRIWDVEKKSLVEILKGHAESVYSLAWNRAGTLLASGAIDGTIRIWDTSTWREVGLLKPGTNVYGISFTPDGKLLAAACADNMIRLWDVKTRQEIAELSGHRDPRPFSGIQPGRFSPRLGFGRQDSPCLGRPFTSRAGQAVADTLILRFLRLIIFGFLHFLAHSAPALSIPLR